MFEYQSKFYFNQGLKIKVDFDFLNYYYWHVLKSSHSTLGLNRPKYSNHISVTLPKLHDKEAVEKSKIYAGQKVSFWYDGNIIIGGSYFTNFWMPIDCPRADEIKREVGIEDKNFLGFHLTLANDKTRINELYPEARELTVQLNKGKLSIDEHRQKMRKIVYEKPN